jgi:hypothetical protein
MADRAMTIPKHRTATDRSNDRYARAGIRLPVVTLDADLAKQWAAHQSATGESWAAFARRMIAEQAK